MLTIYMNCLVCTYCAYNISQVVSLSDCGVNRYAIRKLLDSSFNTQWNTKSTL
jgi:hypothetical protein